ncbi:hypothetical protein ACWF0M_12700 [Kribbella sp. NPDC055110]
MSLNRSVHRQEGHRGSEEARSPRPRCLLRLCTALTIFLFVGLPTPSAEAAEQPGDQTLSATLQDVPDIVGNLRIVVGGPWISALPFRIRVADQSSPIAYSLNLRRPPAFGTSWRAVTEVGERVSKTGVEDPAIATLIARGAPSGQAEVYPRNDFEAAARQIAIWHYTNSLTISAATVPDPALARAASRIVSETDSAIAWKVKIPLQPATYGIDLFTRQVTATEVRVGIALRVDANTHLGSAQDIDLYLDGTRLTVKTHHLTRVHNDGVGSYAADAPEDLPSGENELAEVGVKRNTKVVDLAAIWVNVTSEAGMTFVSDGGGPSVITAQPATYNFRKSMTLDPATYPGPTELLGSIATTLLTFLPGPWSIVAIIVGLYLIARLGRGVDRLLLKAWSRIRRSRKVPKASHEPAARPNEKPPPETFWG